MIDKETENLIKERADIVEVVGDYVHLVRRGSNYMGLCPFHNERTPSFSVNRRKNFCYCFSCHKGGSPVNFLMEKEGLSYHDALLRLADKYGIEVNERDLTDEERERQNERESLMVANRWALEQMEDFLHNTDDGRNIALAYFRQRGITDEAMKAFRLGYSPDRATALTERARSAGFSLDRLHTLGLVGYSAEGNRPYDRFRSRVIFPILNISGTPVAFGGRDIKGTSPAKYINSPETPLYTKSNELYGIFQAKGDIRRDDCCYLVEGYMDVIGMWQAGIRNVVASSGTALTEGQIALIRRLTRNITLIYDGDAAGIKAALRGIDMLLTQGMKVKVVLLPDGHDPDSFAREKTPEEFREHIAAEATDIIRFKTKVLLDDSGSDPAARATAIRSIIESIACIPDAIERMVYVQECAKALHADAETIAAETDREFQRRARSAYAQERTREQRQQQSYQPQQTLQTPTADTVAGTQDTQKSDIRVGIQGPPLKPLEREILRYAVCYGMLDFCPAVDADGNSTYLNVAQYIADDLKVDGIEFSDKTYARIFNIVLNMSEGFTADYNRFYESLCEELEKTRAERIEQIAAEGLDMEGIEKREQQLNDELAAHQQEELQEFATSYITRSLASDPDDDVRRTVTEMILPTHTLSNIYKRQGHVTTEVERLDELVPRSLNELKSAILEVHLNEMRRQLSEASENDDLQRIAELQKEIIELLRLRSQAAMTIGERIISPQNFNRNNRN